eukprot:6198252-Pleurochrysis_carterae.AAC.1
MLYVLCESPRQPQGASNDHATPVVSDGRCGQSSTSPSVRSQSPCVLEQSRGAHLSIRELPGVSACARPVDWIGANSNSP